MGRSGLIHRQMGGTPQAALLTGAERVLKDPAQKGVIELDPATGHPCRLVWRLLSGELAFAPVVFEFLGDAPNFAMPVGRYAADAYYTDNSRATMLHLAKCLRSGLFAFFSQPRLLHVDPTTVTSEHMRDFIDFLRTRNVGESQKNKLYAVARKCLEAIPGVTAELPSNPFSDEKASTPPVLGGNHLYAVLSAAASDVLMHKARFEARSDPDHALWQDPASARILALISTLRSRFPNGPANDGVRRLPVSTEIRTLAPDLEEECESVGFDVLLDWWGPCHANIGSSLVLLMFFFRLNLEIARDMRWGQLDNVDDETIVNKSKKRAREKRQLPGYVNGKAPLDAASLRQFLRDWTADLRVEAGDQGSRVFLMWKARFAFKGPFICHFGSPNAPMRVLTRFAGKYSLEHFTSQMMRPTTIELVDEASEGSQQLAPEVGQHTRAVRNRNYTTPESTWRSLMRIAMAMPVRARDMRSRFAAFALGRIGGNHAAATPGWNCSSPYYRGFSSAPEGELCDAIGRCPACRFGRPDLDCVRSYANVLALLAAVRAEKVKGREVEWNGVFRKVESELVNRWLPSFEKEVRATPVSELPHVPSLVGALRWPTF